jgi:hypothetical protein
MTNCVGPVEIAGNKVSRLGATAALTDSWLRREHHLKKTPESRVILRIAWSVHQHLCPFGSGESKRDEKSSPHFQHPETRYA